MRFYRLHILSENDGSLGFRWFTRKSEAEQELRRLKRNNPEDESKIEVVDINPTKSGILYALEIYASHADNG